MKLAYTLSTSIVAAALLLSGCDDTKPEPIKSHKAISASFIHINDHHSHLSSESKSLYFDGIKTKAQIGGFSRVVSKIKELQASRTNPITLHAGDIIQGTMYYTIFKGEADAKMMEQVIWDAVAVGNHEFDDGDEGLKALLDLMPNVPMVSANVVAEPGNILEGYWEPYKIIEREGEKIGIIGLTIAQKTKVSSSPSDEITFLDEIETTQKYVDELREKDINKIVLLSHYGLDNDIRLAQNVDGIDVIIDGDSHSLVGDFSMVGLTSHYDSYPQKITSKSGEPVCVASAWQYSYVVGDMQVDFSKEGLVEKCSGSPVLMMGDSFTIDGVEVNSTMYSSIMATIDANEQLAIVTQDSDTEAKLAPYTAELDASQNEVIGLASEYLGHNRIPGDTKDGVSTLALGSDIAPVVAKSFYDKSLRANACIQNAGGVRIAIDDGEITIGEAYTLLPFSNTLFEIDMKGSEIKQVLEDALTNYLDNGGSTGSFPYAYGLRYDIDVTKATNARISNLEIMNRDTKIFSEINDATIYVIATNDYIAAGRDGYTTFKTVQDERGEGVNTYIDYALSFVDFVRNLEENAQTLTKLPLSEHPIKSYTDEVNSSSVPLEGSDLPYSVLRDDIEDGSNPGNTFEIRNGGYGSAATAHPSRTNFFYALTDRGPNATYTGVDGKGKIFPTPEYTPRIGLFELNKDGSVTKAKDILLKDRDGENITGLPNSSALGGTGETPYDADGNTLKDASNNILIDDYGLDGEGLAALKDGTFWVSDEYGPHIVHYNEEGVEIDRINAFADDTRVSINLPAEFANRRANRGMEGLTITPDQTTLVGIMQSTMYNPSSAVKTLDITRIVSVNLETKAVKQYLYKQELAANSNSEIVALDNEKFLVIERDGNFLNGGSKTATPTAQKHVYKIDLSTGTELEGVTLNAGMEQNATHGLTIDGETLEEVVLNHTWTKLSANGITPVSKTIVVDMAAAVDYPHDKMEGLIVIDESTLGVLNDDDFATWSSGGVLEKKVITVDDVNITDKNTLYIVKELDLSTN
ncbi:MAG: NAD nucleotidase [Campylobacterota bacterium]|nr:NAD nucleotidase [Campylobacterota bacterium]